MEKDTINDELMLPKFNGLKIYCGGDNNCAMCANILENKNVLQTGNMWIAPDFGAITEGYLLIFSNRCTPSVGHFNKNEFKEIEIIINTTRNILSKKFNKKVVFFEHGALDGDSKKAGCCVAHAHIHAVPVDTDINLNLFEKELKAYVGTLKRKKIQNLTTLKERIKLNSSYLLYISSKGEKIVYDIGEKQIPSQMFRKYISNLSEVRKKNVDWLEKNNIIGVENLTWDWRHFRPSDRYNSTAKYLLSEFRGDLDEASKR